MPTRRSQAKATDSSVGPLESWERWVKGLEIREVVADQISMTVDRAGWPVAGSTGLEVKYRLDPQSAEVAGSDLLVGFAFELRIGPQRRSGKAPLLQLRMAYHSRYTCPEGPEPTAEGIAKFHKHLAAAHVFPFVRAHVADLMGRAGLPPLILPLSHPPTAARP